MLGLCDTSDYYFQVIAPFCNRLMHPTYNHIISWDIPWEVHILLLQPQKFKGMYVSWPQLGLSLKYYGMIWLKSITSLMVPLGITSRNFKVSHNSTWQSQPSSTTLKCCQFLKLRRHQQEINICYHSLLRYWDLGFILKTNRFLKYQIQNFSISHCQKMFLSDRQAHLKLFKYF